MSNNEPVVITGEENIRLAGLLALRGALRIQAVTGIRRYGRSALQIANERMGTRYRTAQAAYPAFDAWLVAQDPARVKSWPLPEKEDK